MTDKRPALAYDTDVLVVGGGAAGVAAAVTAARAGAKVLLLEKYGFCGGAAVAGLSGTVCGLYTPPTDAQRPPRPNRSSSASPTDVRRTSCARRAA